ncbi:unnamed protein product, partial [Effrenium voratum]
VSSMTELFRTLRIAEEICLKLSFISGRLGVPMRFGVWRLDLSGPWAPADREAQ